MFPCSGAGLTYFGCLGYPKKLINYFDLKGQINTKINFQCCNHISVWFNGVRVSYTVGVSLCFLALVLDYMFFLMSRFQTVLWFNAIITIIINISSKLRKMKQGRLPIKNNMCAYIPTKLIGFPSGPKGLKQGFKTLQKFYVFSYD